MLLTLYASDQFLCFQRYFRETNHIHLQSGLRKCALKIQENLGFRTFYSFDSTDKNSQAVRGFTCLAKAAFIHRL